MDVCEHCGKKTAQLYTYTATGGFRWDFLCEHCRDRLNLEDWIDSCRLTPKDTRNAINQTQ